MKGSQLTVYANQSHRVEHVSVVDWLLHLIEKCDIHGATVIEVSEGIDAHGKLHAARFFELADQPVAVTVASSDTHIDDLLAHLKAANVRLFYTRLPVEYGELGEN